MRMTQKQDRCLYNLLTPKFPSFSKEVCTPKVLGAFLCWGAFVWERNCISCIMRCVWRGSDGKQMHGFATCEQRFFPR